MGRKLTGLFEIKLDASATLFVSLLFNALPPKTDKAYAIQLYDYCLTFYDEVQVYSFMNSQLTQLRFVLFGTHDAYLSAL